VLIFVTCAQAVLELKI